MKNNQFTDEEIENAKKAIISAIHTIDDEQDTTITYYFGQEISNQKNTIENYIKKIEKIKREDVLNIANKVEMHTIYFLRY